MARDRGQGKPPTYDRGPAIAFGIVFFFFAAVRRTFVTSSSEISSRIAHAFRRRGGDSVESPRPVAAFVVSSRFRPRGHEPRRRFLLGETATRFKTLEWRSRRLRRRRAFDRFSDRGRPCQNESEHEAETRRSAGSFAGARTDARASSLRRTSRLRRVRASRL